MGEFLSFFDGEAVSKFCKRTHPKSLSWKERDFSPPSLHKRRGKGVELFNLSIATQTLGLGVTIGEFLSFFDGEAVSKLCKRTHPKSLSWEEKGEGWISYVTRL
jgi:hypothetical protein